MSDRFNRVVRQCPLCQHWWFDRMRHGCKIDSARRTNTTAELSSEFAAGECKDFQPAVIKMPGDVPFESPNGLDIDIASRSFEDEQGNVSPTHAFQAGARWMLEQVEELNQRHSKMPLYGRKQR